MKRILMKSTVKGYDTHRELITYKDGQVYEVGESLAKAFVIDQGVATYQDEPEQSQKKLTIEYETKDVQYVAVETPTHNAETEQAEQTTPAEMIATIQAFTDKNELEAWAIANLGVDVDKRRTIKTLKAELMEKVTNG
jgi:hypothetical protein